MNENKAFGVSSYDIFDEASSNINFLNNKVSTAGEDLQEVQTKLSSESIFMGPIADSCKEELSKIIGEYPNIQQKLNNMISALNTTSSSYQALDKLSKKNYSAAGIKNELTDKKNINIKNIKAGSNVANALTKYNSELKGAEYATVNDKIFTTTKTEMINGQPVKVTHVVINNPNQINGAPANGIYGNGLETSSSAANRLNSAILVNGSHFRSDGKEDLQGANNIVIVNGEIKKDGVSGGQELLLDNAGNIYNAVGKSAQQLVDDGVKYSFACHSTQVIENGDTSPSYNEPRHYMRTVIGQSNPGEYYIVTDTTENNVLSDTAEYLKEKGCNNAYSLDQGGSVTLVRDNNVINTPRDGSEREVGDFLYFTA